MPFVFLLLVGISHFVHAGAGNAADLAPFLEHFLPPSGAGRANEIAIFAQNMLRAIVSNRTSLSVVATLVFLWFSTRLFASVRNSLNRIYKVAAPAHRDRHFLVRMLLNKGWDVVMVGMLLLLFLGDILVSAGLAAAEAWSIAAIPGSRESVSYLSRLLNIGVGFTFAFIVFTLVYRYASSRPVRWRTASVAATFTALGVELAKRLFALYLAGTSGVNGIAAWGSFTTVALLVLWAYYTANIFLLGGVVAETWAERGMLIEQSTAETPIP